MTLFRPACAAEEGAAWWCQPANRVYVLRTSGDADALTELCQGVSCHDDLAEDLATDESAFEELWSDPRFSAVRPRLSDRVADVGADSDGNARLVLGGRNRNGRKRPVSLDRIGTSVVSQCDGHRTLGEILERFTREHQLHPREAELSVLSFLETLRKRGMVVVDKVEDP